MQNPAIFPLFYLPPVSYFTLLKENNFEFNLEKFEHFPKQTYRNRATIASPNGSLDMVIPVTRGSKLHTPYKDVKISYEDRWQRLHWLSMQTCYRSSAYFEFYEDGLAPFYEKRYDYLFDYNYAMLTWLFKQLKLSVNLTSTESYETKIEVDYRNVMTKKEVPSVQTKPYFQVFSDRNEFISNLSIADLLFNQGPQAKNYF
ncbi:WbqC family protein [Pedobacter xixiisoli]|uniref:WbqC-like protein family protein n=1 Tax=Pedobacter xixiisoli TaxID=1476464 RepID=A0A285ZX72_9SPHI|nr:WbqC family protein [Pedobacter xixiisoli]SOD14263.1 WbqC-like protein family protein [Pedobacter xixiisoli]